MIKKNNKTIIGVDHGYGYIKTAKTITKSGIEEMIIEPPFNEDILVYGSSVYAVGQHRTEQPSNKTENMDYYILTLAAIAKEMKEHNMRKINDVIIAAGLPYSFMAKQAPNFKRYLTKQKNVEFTFEGIKYSINIKGAEIYPQGFPMIALKLGKNKSMEESIVDIGSRTIDILTFLDGKPIYDKCFSIDKMGTLDCVDLINKYYLSEYQERIDEETIQNIFQNKRVSLPDDRAKFIKKIIKFYINNVCRQLDAKGIKYNVTYCGGGATVLKNYGPVIDSSCKIDDDIYGNAKGYELLAYNTTK